MNNNKPTPTPEATGATTELSGGANVAKAENGGQPSMTFTGGQDDNKYPEVTSTPEATAEAMVQNSDQPQLMLQPVATNPSAEAEPSPSPMPVAAVTTGEGNSETTDGDASTASTVTVTLEPTPTAPPDVAPAPSGSILPIVIAVAVVLAAAAALGIVLSHRKRQAEARRTYPEASTKIPRNLRSGGTAPVKPSQLQTEQIMPDAPMASRYRVGFAQTQGSRENQEDSFCISNWKDERAVSSLGLLAAVADGIGGLSNGQLASSTVVRNMCTRFENQNVGMALSDRLLELAAQSQQDVLSIVQQRGNCGTTLVSVLIKDGQMVMLSVGDSRVSLYRSGVLLQLNREHVLGKESDENTMLNHAAQNNDTRKRKAITAYLGKPNLRLIDRTLNPMKLMSGDRILLMSDGVFGSLSDDEIIAAMQAPPDRAAQMVIQTVEAKRLPHQDNATIIIVEMQ